MINLEDKVIHYAQKYYEGNPEISDEEFDKLITKLITENPTSKILYTTGWGYNPYFSPLQKIDHMYRDMSGISNKISIDTFKTKYLKKDRLNYLSSKLDGASIALYYDRGKLIRALTRGDGKIGLDVTDKLSIIVPTTLKYNHNFTGRIRGEFVLPREVYEVNYKPIGFKSPRNTASGFLNSKEFNSNSIKDFLFIAYTITNKDGEDINCINSEFKLKEDNFNVVNYTHIIDDDFKTSTANTILHNLSQYEYVVDGIKYNHTVDCDGLIGYLDDNSIYALKWNTESAITNVTNVKWKLSRTGKLVPVIEIEPTELLDATIRNVSGFNAKYIIDNEIGKDSTVEIVRSGDIIPHIINIISEGKLDIPKNCPSCNSQLEISGVDLICTNKNCSNIDKKDLEIWVNTIGKIDGLGSTLKFKFLDELEYTTVEDLYTNSNILEVNRSIQREKFNQMLDIVRTGNIKIVDALCALNIPRLGRTTATKLINKPDIIKSIINDSINKDKLIKILGSSTTESILNNKNKFNRLLLLEDRIIYEYNNTNKNDLLKLCVTGSLNNFKSRKELFEEHKELVIETNINKCDYLVNNNINSNSSKNRKARELNKPIITEEELLKLLDNN